MRLEAILGHDGAQCSLVQFGDVDLDVAEVWPLDWVLGPAAFHQDGQLLTVAAVVCGGPKVRTLVVTHLLHYLCNRQDKVCVSVCVLHSLGKQ